MISIDKLEQIGLTKNEAKVYLALLDLGRPVQVGIISRKADIHRRSVYDILDRLIEKGIVSYIVENKKRMYNTANPEKLMDIIKEKEQILNEILPELKAQFSFEKENEGTQFFRGINGLKTIYEDILKENKELFVLGASRNVDDVLKYYFQKYLEKRNKKKLPVKLIYKESDRPVKIKTKFTQIKYIDDKFMSNLSLEIYGDKTAIILWRTKPLAILIQNQEMTDGFRNYFKLLWNISKK